MNIDSEYLELYNKLSSLPNFPKDKFAKAYEVAKSAHKNQFRKSGDPYIHHPLMVANILKGMEMDPDTIIAALLHDTVEDSEITLEDIEEEFGGEIALLVEGVTNLGKLSFGSREEQQAENFRKMFLAMSSDIRVILIKMADRLHNMRTLEFLSAEQQYYIAKETKEIYAPLAHRLGMGRIKWELEDLSFRFLEPEEFNRVKSLVAERREKREKYLERFIQGIEEILEKENVKARITGRPKHFLSISKKMRTQNLEFTDVYDLLAIRIIVEKVSQCYEIIGLAHALFKPIPGKFKDYIAMPKNNLYSSLHTTVIGYEGRPVEIQIRTEEMHQVNEYGVAAHWKYKENSRGADKGYEEKLIWLRQLIEWQKDLSDAKEFMDNLKLNLFVDTVFVFTPKGDVHELKRSSTPIDFAYHVHTEVGHRCIGAKVNGQIVQLNYRLENGDIVDIITGKKDQPKRDWLDFIESSQAKSKIKIWFRKTEGQIILSQSTGANSQAKKEKKQNIIDKLRGRNTENKKQKKKRRSEDDIIIPGTTNVQFYIAKCCHPIPGDATIGLITRGHGVSIHKSNCQNIIEDTKVVRVEWSTDTVGNYLAALEVEAINRKGLLSEIMGAVSAIDINIREANIYSKRTRNSVISKILVEVHSTKELLKVISAIQNVKNVFSVSRV